MTSSSSSLKVLNQCKLLIGGRAYTTEKWKTLDTGVVLMHTNLAWKDLKADSAGAATRDGLVRGRAC